MTMMRPAAVSSWPPLAYVWPITSLSFRSYRVRIAALFGAGALQERVDSLEDLLVEDEDEAEHEERENRRDGYPYEPVPAFLLPRGDPALYRRQPEHEQEE